MNSKFRQPAESRALAAALLIGGLLALAAGCSPSGDGQAAVAVAVVETVAVEFPDGDPAVAGDQGGPGFAPLPSEGWQTVQHFPAEGSEQAIPGGAVRYWMRFPPTLRSVGKDSSTQANRVIEDLCYESLLMRHSATLEFIPRLATHWWISADNLTFRYRLNPRAHWGDGHPVVASDVIATWELLTDSTILQPSKQVVFDRFERPVALSKYLVEVRAKSPSWRNFVDFSQMTILPAHQIGGVAGSEYLTRHQFQPLVGSGPYSLQASDVKRGHYVTLRRRDEYWGRGERFAAGLYNFDLIRLVSTEDSVLALEKAKKGELDIFPVGKAKDWAVDLPRLDQVQRGLLVMCLIENDRPVGADGIVMNMRVPPLDDERVRKALCHLYNRRKLIDKLFYGQYRHLDSYFPGSDYANPSNELIRYDPDAAQSLLRSAGWRDFDSDGVLIKEGRRLELELIYSSKSVERYLSIFQEDCARAGVRVHLKQLTRASRFQTTYGNRKFQLATQGFGGSVDPSPGETWLSSLADEKNNNNLAGIKSPRLDELCLQYEAAYAAQERSEKLRLIDAEIFRHHPCILGWHSPDIRLIFWNKFGQPESFLGRTWRPEDVLKSWWLDPVQEKQLRKAKRDNSLILDTPPHVIKF